MVRRHECIGGSDRRSYPFVVPAGCTSIDVRYNVGPRPAGAVMAFAAPQLEIGADATSWILTAGSPVSRAADVAALIAGTGIAMCG